MPFQERGTHQELPIDLVSLAISDSKVDGVVLGKPKYSLEELVDITGWSLDELKALWLWSGTSPTTYGERVFTETDAAGLIGLRDFTQGDNRDFESVGSLVRSISYSMERLALTQVESIVQSLVKSGMTDTEARLVATEYAPTQNEALVQQIETLWRRHFAAAIHRLTTETILLRGASDDDEQFPLVVGVGFARIVDFTEKTADFGVESYARFVQAFHNLASDIINSIGGRVVKIMGDIIVWVTPHAATAAEIALRLAALEHEIFDAQIQAAITWCRVMSLHGDVFGPGVNLAARLCEIAPAGKVLIDDAAASQFVRDPRYLISPQPEVEIKGLNKVRPWLLAAAPGSKASADADEEPLA